MLHPVDEDNDLESEDQGGEGEDKDTGEGDTKDDKPGSAYTWYSMIDTVSETTHEPWSVVWDMGIYEFFNILGFAYERAQRRKKEMMKWKNQKTY